MQTNWNLDDLIADVAATVENHKTAQPGAYARYLWDNAQHTRKLGSNEYGCADAANILYTLGCFPREPEERAAFVRARPRAPRAFGCCRIFSTRTAGSTKGRTIRCTAPRTARRRWNCLTRCRGSRWRFANPTARWTGCMRCWTA